MGERRLARWNRLVSPVLKTFNSFSSMLDPEGSFTSPGKSSVPNEVKGNVADGRRAEFKLSRPSVLFLAVIREKGRQKRYVSSIIKASPERIPPYCRDENNNPRTNVRGAT